MVNADKLESAPEINLCRRLDQADTDRRQTLDRLAAAQERIAALLTDQRGGAVPAIVVALAVRINQD